MTRLVCAALVIVGLVGCAPGVLVVPARPAPEAEALEETLEDRGPWLRPEIFSREGVLELRDTALTGRSLAEFLSGETEELDGYGRLDRMRFDHDRIYVCPDGVIQVGRYTAYQRLPGPATSVPISGRWLAHWEHRGSEWRIHRAVLRPSLLHTTWLAIDPDCVGPTERSAARRPLSVTGHWGGVWTHGGARSGIEAQLRYAGLGEAGTTGTTSALSVGRRMVGPWGGRVILGRRLASGTQLRVEQPTELTAATTMAGLLAMHERWLIRIAAGPAVAHVAWEWSGGETTTSSEWSFGWVNEVAVAIPVSERFFLDLSYHDWLVGDSSPPEYLGVASIDLRLRGSTLSLGVGGRF